MKILVLNGPNLNMLGVREPDIYGKGSYDELVRIIGEYSAGHGVGASFYQSNHEGGLVDAIQQAYYDKVDGIVINPGAYTHTSIAIADAVKAVSIPTVEVHISDVTSRESYRQISYIREVAVKTISGLGFDGYLRAIDTLLEYIGEQK